MALERVQFGGPYGALGSLPQHARKARKIAARRAKYRLQHRGGDERRARRPRPAPRSPAVWFRWARETCETGRSSRGAVRRTPVPDRARSCARASPSPLRGSSTARSNCGIKVGRRGKYFASSGFRLQNRGNRVADSARAQARRAAPPVARQRPSFHSRSVTTLLASSAGEALDTAADALLWDLLCAAMCAATPVPPRCESGKTARANPASRPQSRSAA